MANPSLIDVHLGDSLCWHVPRRSCKPGMTCLFFKHLKAVQERDCGERQDICESPEFCKCVRVSCFSELAWLSKVTSQHEFLRIFATQGRASAYKIFPLCLVHGAWEKGGGREALRLLTLLLHNSPRGADSGGCVVRPVYLWLAVVGICKEFHHLLFPKPFPFNAMQSPILEIGQLFLLLLSVSSERERSVSTRGRFLRSWL